jgi:hypothetical protein
VTSNIVMQSGIDAPSVYMMLVAVGSHLLLDHVIDSWVEVEAASGRLVMCTDLWLGFSFNRGRYNDLFNDTGAAKCTSNGIA